MHMTDSLTFWKSLWSRRGVHARHRPEQGVRRECRNRRQVCEISSGNPVATLVIPG